MWGLRFSVCTASNATCHIYSLVRKMISRFVSKDLDQFSDFEFRVKINPVSSSLQSGSENQMKIYCRSLGDHLKICMCRNQ